MTTELDQVPAPALSKHVQLIAEKDCIMLELQTSSLFFVATACAGLFIAGALKGLTGLGYTTCALPILAAVMNLKSAVCLTVLPALASCLVLSYKSLHFLETLGRFRVLHSAMMIGIATGLALVSSIDDKLTTQGLGVITVGYAIFAILNPEMHLSVRSEKILQGPVGFANGVLTGLTGSQIMPLVPYLLALKLDPTRMVQAANTSVIIGSSVMVIGLFLKGIFTPSLAAISLLGILPATLGVTLGDTVRRMVPPTRFRTIVLTVIGLMGISLLAKS